jgi:hypothetical protein
MTSRARNFHSGIGWLALNVLLAGRTGEFNIAHSLEWVPGLILGQEDCRNGKKLSIKG